MSSLNNDIKSVLNCYVKRKSSGEIKFDEKQEKSGLKLCERIIHEKSKKGTGREKLKLLTQISNVSDTCDTPTPVASTQRSLTDTANQNLSKDESVSSTSQDYYLKKVELSHFKGKSKSLNTEECDLGSGCHQTEITTVIGDVTTNHYERVHSATIYHSSCATLPEHHRAYTRQVPVQGTGTVSSTSSGASRPSSYRSLPSQLNNVLLGPTTNSDDTSAVAPGNKGSKKSKKKTKRFRQRLKRLFSTSSTSSAAPQQQQQSPFPTAAVREPGYDLVDMLFEQKSTKVIEGFQAQSLSDTPCNVIGRGPSKPQEQKNKRSNFFTGTAPPFRSHSIGAKSHSSTLPPLPVENNVCSAKMRMQDLQPLANRKGGSIPMSNTGTGTGTGKDIPQFLKSLLMGKRRQAKHKGVSNGTAVVISDVRTVKRCGVPSDDNNNEVLVEHSRDKNGTMVHATIDLVDEGRPVTLVAKLEIGESQEHVEYQAFENGRDMVDGNDDDNVFHTTTMSNRQRSMSGVSFSHIDMLTAMHKQRRPSCPAVPKCDCETRRLSLIVDSLNMMIFKNKDKDQKKEKMRELKQIDPGTCHFKNCEMVAFAANEFESPTSHMGCGRSQSQASLYSIHSCLMCQEPDEQLDEDVAETLLPLMAQLENEDDLNIPQNTIEHFLYASCYDHFEEGLIKVIGSECTPKNVSRLHYLVRRIVKHIGDPTDESNKKIKNILNHTCRFYLHFYQPHIKSMYQTLENFLLSGLKNDDVD